MSEERAKIRAPELEDGIWLNSPPLSMRGLRGRAVLIDFWDYTCVNCIRTLPYVKEWHRRYADKGLTVIGVHAPEFHFARWTDNVKRAIERFEISYPVVIDNDYRIWNAYANRYWPAKYLTDRKGYLRYYNLGEGNYLETELAIQQLLREIDPAAELPQPMEPVRDSDYPGAYCPRVTPELYLGYRRGLMGNAEGYRPEETVEYQQPQRIEEDRFYAVGRWLNRPEYMLLSEEEGRAGQIILRYTASEVNLVLRPVERSEALVYLEQDGGPVEPADKGDDVEYDDSGRSLVRVREPRMYNLIKNRRIGAHSLKLTSFGSGLAAYAFTFVSCVDLEESSKLKELYNELIKKIKVE